MEKIKPENLEEQMEAFREELGPILSAELKIEEGTMIRKVTGRPIVNVGDLTVADMAIWQKSKDRIITMPDVKAYDADFESVHGAIKEDLPDIPFTRRLFRNILHQKATSVMADREMDELERKEGKQK